MSTHQIHFGRKFYSKTDGYWVCTAKSCLYAHRWVWTLMVGEIPRGMVIHHIDGNRGNNEISNLQMLEKSTHTKLHWRKKKNNPNQLWLPI